jgi:hypothetical protein
VAAKENCWQDKLDESQRRWHHVWLRGRAVEVPVDPESLVLVILEAEGSSIPGEDTQFLILIDPKGRLRDMLTLSASNRMTRGHAILHTVVLHQPEPDGTRVVVRLDGNSARGNFAHYIEHSGELKRFYWGQQHVPLDQPTEWDVRGLCRIALAAGRFQVVYP